MLQPRTVKEIQDTYYAGLVESGSGLVLDQKEGSLAYTLSRASAAVGVYQDNRMAELERQSTLLSATGAYLDNLGFGLSVRETAASSTGSVMAIAKTGSVSIPTNTTLIHLPSNRQFVVTTGGSVLNLYETTLSIASVEMGTANNLAAGISLFAPQYPDVCFHVGSSHTDAYYGDLIGGKDLESDDSYRQRLLQILAEGVSSSSSESNLLRQLLSYPSVERAFVKTRVPGVVEIWVDASVTYTEAQRTDILTYIRSYIAAGVVPTLIQAKRVAVNLTIDVRPFASSGQDLSRLSRNLTSVINNYLNNLDLGQSLLLANLRQVLAPLAREVYITYPTEDIICGFNEILVPGEIKYTFPSSF